MTKITENITGQIEVKKRGRKSKKEIEEAKKLLENKKEEPIIVTFNETLKAQNETIYVDEVEEHGQDNIILKTTQPTNEDKPAVKKRGRKPKGGKIVQQIVPINSNKESKTNVILHLKCFLKDLNYNSIGQNLEGYSFNSSNNIFCLLNNEEPTSDYNVQSKITENDGALDSDDCDNELNNNNDIRDIWKKLKILENNLHTNYSENKSACFWDTCDFDNPPVYIPKFFMNDAYHVYGCFCSPECAVAYLMEEHIDSSVKFERYQLINHLYSKVYNYKKNIKPAPNPFYMLEKYYGNLSIQDYRTLLSNDRLFLIVDKPLTRTMPELHEDNDDFIINNKIIPSNTYQIKKKLQKKQTKNNILTERFGLTNN